MAIQFARVEFAGRSKNKNACCKAAYTSRGIIKDEQSGKVYDFSHLPDNVYHKMLLPKGVDKKFLSPKNMSNEIEASEKKSNSQLYKEYVLALPGDEQVSLEDKIEMVHRFIDESEFIENRLSVQIDIHMPHEGEKNWHAHLLVPTRRFKEDGLSLGQKVRDLNPLIRGGINPFVSDRKENIGKIWRDIQNTHFRENEMDLVVDAISTFPGVHIGPERMRAMMEEAGAQKIYQMPVKEIASNGEELIDRVSKRGGVFSNEDLMRELSDIEDDNLKEKIIKEGLASNKIIKLYDKAGVSDNKSGLYITKDARRDEERLKRIGESLSNRRFKGIFDGGASTRYIKSGKLSDHQGKELGKLLQDKSALRIIEGRAGTGKTRVLDCLKESIECDCNVIGLGPTHRTAQILKSVGYSDADTIKGYLFKHKNNKIETPDRGSVFVIDEASMVDVFSLIEIMKLVRDVGGCIILAGDSRQLDSIERGGGFEFLSSNYGSFNLDKIIRQKRILGREFASLLARGELSKAVDILYDFGNIKWSNDAKSTKSRLLSDWSRSSLQIKDKLIIAKAGINVDILNKGAREILKSKGFLKGDSYDIECAGRKGNYCAGDRVIITRADRDLLHAKGEFGFIERLDQNNVEIKLDSGQIVSSGVGRLWMRHGYAVSVCNAQGANVEDSYIYNSSGLGNKSSYVALTRHRDEAYLYCNRNSCKDKEALISQLARPEGREFSLAYRIESDMKQKTRVGALVRGISNLAAKVGDYMDDNNYYRYKDSGESQVLNIKKAANLLDKNNESKLETGNDNMLEDDREYRYRKPIIDKEALSDQRKLDRFMRAREDRLKLENLYARSRDDGYRGDICYEGKDRVVFGRDSSGELSCAKIGSGPYTRFVGRTTSQAASVQRGIGRVSVLTPCLEDAIRLRKLRVPCNIDWSFKISNIGNLSDHYRSKNRDDLVVVARPGYEPGSREIKSFDRGCRALERSGARMMVVDSRDMDSLRKVIGKEIDSRWLDIWRSADRFVMSDSDMLKEADGAVLAERYNLAKEQRQKAYNGFMDLKKDELIKLGSRISEKEMNDLRQDLWSRDGSDREICLDEALERSSSAYNMSKSEFMRYLDKNIEYLEDKEHRAGRMPYEMHHVEITDIYGKQWRYADDYLASIGRDKNLVDIIDYNSLIGERIKVVLKDLDEDGICLGENPKIPDVSRDWFRSKVEGDLKYLSNKYHKRDKEFGVKDIYGRLWSDKNKYLASIGRDKRQHDLIDYNSVVGYEIKVALQDLDKDGLYIGENPELPKHIAYMNSIEFGSMVEKNAKHLVYGSRGMKFPIQDVYGRLWSDEDKYLASIGRDKRQHGLVNYDTALGRKIKLALKDLDRDGLYLGENPKVPDNILRLGRQEFTSMIEKNVESLDNSYRRGEYVLIEDVYGRLWSDKNKYLASIGRDKRQHDLIDYNSVVGYEIKVALQDLDKDGLYIGENPELPKHIAYMNSIEFGSMVEKNAKHLVYGSRGMKFPIQDVYGRLWSDEDKYLASIGRDKRQHGLVNYDTALGRKIKLALKDLDRDGLYLGENPKVPDNILRLGRQEFTSMIEKNVESLDNSYRRGEYVLIEDVYGRLWSDRAKYMASVGQDKNVQCLIDYNSRIGREIIRMVDLRSRCEEKEIERGVELSMEL